MKKDPLQILAPLFLAPFFIGLWYFIVFVLGSDRSFLLPAPHQIIAALVNNRAEITSAALNTGLGALAGFLGASLFGITGALLLSLSPWLRRGLYPYLMVLQLTPVVVISPVLVLWVGAGFRSVAVITFCICVFPLIVNTTQGLISTDRNLVELFKMGRAGKIQELRLLRIPAALPYFFTGLRIAATLAPIGAVVGDFTAGDSAGAGLGFLTIIYSANFRYPELFASVAANCLLGFFFTGATVLLARACLGHWHDSYAKDL